MEYKKYLEDKNLSQNTIRVYLLIHNIWKKFISDKVITKTLFVNFIKSYASNHQANSVHLVYSVILSILKFEKKWKLINECKDIKLPKIQITNKTIINLKDFNNIKNNIVLLNWFDKRNWLIFCCFFLTGVRASEIMQIKKSKIYDHNKIKIIGKGNKTRIIYLPTYLIELLNDWQHDEITITRKNKSITSKQIIYIINKTSLKYFNKKITPHDLRRSYATNLLKNHANIEIVRKSLGHSNINTTARYLQFNDDEMIEEINKVFN